MYNRILVLISFLFFTICLNAQRTISGVVISGDNQERLPFSDIIIKGTNQGTSTNVDGFFSLIDVPEDSLILQIFYVGYSTKELRIEAGNLDVKNLKIELQSGVQLGEVVVSSKSYKVMNASEGVSTIQISPAQLSLLPNVGEVDIFRSLQLLPGVSGSNESSSGLYVRGGTPDQNLVLLDGMTVYNVDHFFGFFSAFNADAVKDVQLFKGAFPAKYGGRLSSVVDLTGKTGNPTKVQGNVGLNLLNARAGIQIPLFKKGSFSIYGRRSYTDIIRSGVYNKIFDVFTQTENPPDIDGLEINTIEPDFYFFDLNSKLSYSPTEKDVVALSYYSGADHLVELNEVRLERGENPTILIELDVDEKNDWGNKGFSGKWSRQWNPKLYSNFLLANSNYFSKYDRAVDILVSLVEQDTVVLDTENLTFEDNDVNDLTVRLDFEYQLNSRHKLEFGGTSTLAEVDYQFIRDDTLSILDLQQEASFTAAYVSDTWTPISRLYITAGLRTTYYDIDDKFYWAPRFSFQYNLTKKISLKGGYGKHYQFVNRIVNENVTEGSRDFWLLADDDLVKVSSAEHFVLGVGYETDNYIFDVEAYRKELGNLSEFSLRFQRDDIDLDKLFFSGNGYAEGIEFLFQKKKGDYTGWVTYTLAQVRNNFPELNNGFEFSALHDQRHEFKTVHSYEWEKFRLAATFVFGSGKPFTEPSGQYSVELLDGRTFNYISVGAKNASRLPAYHRLDLSVHYLTDYKGLDIDVGLSIFNFYDRQNVWYREYDFTQAPPVISEVRYLGLTPNLSVDLKF
ncbi:MAG: TonB-dependent receptor [Saprospiraceae bacterium]|nr:TonB-dependent receptor [Saprospiraceae bacterium]